MRSENTDQVQEDVGNTVGNHEDGEQDAVDGDHHQNEEAVEYPQPGVGEGLGGDSIEKKCWLEFWLEKRLEIPF